MTRGPRENFRAFVAGTSGGTITDLDGLEAALTAIAAGAMTGRSLVRIHG